MWELFHAIFIHLIVSLKTRRCVRKAKSLCHIYHHLRKSLSKMEAWNEANLFQTVGLSISAMWFVQSKSEARRDTTAKKINDEVQNVGSVQTRQYYWQRAEMSPCTVQPSHKWAQRLRSKHRRSLALPHKGSLCFCSPYQRGWNKIEEYVVILLHITKKISFSPWAYSVVPLYSSIQFLKQKPISITQPVSTKAK